MCISESPLLHCITYSLYDLQVNSLMERSMDNLISVFMVIGLITVSIIVTVLLAVQVRPVTLVSDMVY